MLVGIMVGSFLERQVAQPRVRTIEGQSASAGTHRWPDVEADQKKANVVEQKPPAPDHETLAFAEDVDWKMYGSEKLNGEKAVCFFDAKGMYLSAEGYIRVWTK